MSEKRYHVVPRGDGRWAVKRQGADRATRVFELRQTATALGKRLALGGVLYVHRRDGTIEERMEL